MVFQQYTHLIADVIDFMDTIGSQGMIIQPQNNNINEASFKFFEKSNDT